MIECHSFQELKLLKKQTKKDTELLALGETVLKGQQPQQLNQMQDSESDSESSNKFPQSRIPFNGNERSRSDSLNSSSQVEPSSAVLGTTNNLTRPGISFADTSYRGNSRFNLNGSNEFVNNPYENPYARARQNNNGSNNRF